MQNFTVEGIPNVGGPIFDRRKEILLLGKALKINCKFSGNIFFNFRTGYWIIWIGDNGGLGAEPQKARKNFTNCIEIGQNVKKLNQIAKISRFWRGYGQRYND